MKKLLGYKYGKRVYATYNHRSGSLPELRISGQVWRGSSLGPANPDAEPSGDDVDYWREIARGEKLID